MGAADVADRAAVLIVESTRRLTATDHTDPAGRAMAVVTVLTVRPWTPEDAAVACSTYEPGWLAWVLTDIHPIAEPFQVLAARKIYELEVDSARLIDAAGRSI